MWNNIHDIHHCNHSIYTEHDIHRLTATSVPLFDAREIQITRQASLFLLFFYLPAWPRRRMHHAGYIWANPFSLTLRASLLSCTTVRVDFGCHGSQITTLWRKIYVGTVYGSFSMVKLGDLDLEVMQLCCIASSQQPPSRYLLRNGHCVWTMSSRCNKKMQWPNGQMCGGKAESAACPGKPGWVLF